MLKLAVPVAVVCALSAGCGQLSQEDARAVWSSVSGQLGSTTGQALTTDVDLTRDCPDGGSLSFQGSLDTGDAQAIDATVSAEFSYQVTLAACADDGDTIDGNLNYTSSLGTASGDGTAGTSVIFEYSGAFSVSGAHNGSCDVDMQGHLDAAASTGTINTATVSLVYEGTICGHDASETLNVSSSD